MSLIETMKRHVEEDGAEVRKVRKLGGGNAQIEVGGLLQAEGIVGTVPCKCRKALLTRR